MSAPSPPAPRRRSACVFTLIALFTGAVWGATDLGQPGGEWGPRGLTSFLILFLFYLGYIALWEAIEDPDTAADLTAVLCMVGSVFCDSQPLRSQVLGPGPAPGQHHRQGRANATRCMPAITCRR